MAAPPRPPFPAFWVRKMRSFFILLDRDGDGIVHKDDFMFVSTRAKLFLTTEKAEAAGILCKNVWEIFWGGVLNKDTVTMDEMIATHAANLTDPNYDEKAGYWFEFYFDIMAAGRGFMTLKDHAGSLGIFGVHPLSVTPSFQAIDTNGDGLISKEEFVKAGIDFFIKTVDTPAKLFFGPMLA